jgi:hypothetical protein
VNGTPLLQAAQRRSKLGAAISVTIWAAYLLVGLALLLGVVVTAGFGHWIYGDLAAARPEPTTFKGWGDDFLFELFKPLFVYALIPLMLAKLVGTVYLAFFVIPSIITLPGTLPFSLGWRTPGRILVFRPFHHQPASKALSRVIQREVAPFGHVYTLSDPHIRKQQLRKPRDLERIPALIGSRMRRNLNWVLGRSRVFPLTCTDSIWRQCVEALVKKVDAIVIDLTDRSDNVEWEIALCRTESALSRVVFVVRAEEEGAARVFLNEQVSQQAPLFSDDARGEVSPTFASEVAELLSRSLTRA